MTRVILSSLAVAAVLALVALPAPADIVNESMPLNFGKVKTRIEPDKKKATKPKRVRSLPGQRSRGPKEALPSGR